MNDKIEVFAGAPRISYGNDLVGFALVSAFNDGSPLLLGVVRGMVMDAFRRARIHHDETAGGFGPNFALATIVVTDKGPALDCLCGLARACGLADVASVAWHDGSENVWRSVPQCAGRLSFGDFQKLITSLDPQWMQAQIEARGRTLVGAHKAEEQKPHDDEP